MEFWWFDDSMRMDDKMDGMSFFGEVEAERRIVKCRRNLL